MAFLSKIFTDLRNQLKNHGLMNEKLNDETLPKVAHDKEVRMGCKRKYKFWYGYKHVSVDKQTGLINKVLR